MVDGDPRPQGELLPTRSRGPVSTSDGRRDLVGGEAVAPGAHQVTDVLTARFAVALPDVRVIAVSPGHTATDLNGHQGTDTPEEGVRAVVAAVTDEIDVPTGSFADSTGVVPW